jgi:hypothetical protein
VFYLKSDGLFSHCLCHQENKPVMWIQVPCVCGDGLCKVWPVLPSQYELMRLQLYSLCPTISPSSDSEGATHMVCIDL